MSLPLTRKLSCAKLSVAMAALVLTAGSGAALAQRKPVILGQGVTIGRVMFAPGDTDAGGHGQVIDGIEGSSQEMLKQHIHAHLSLFYKGEQIAIPEGIGIIKPFREENGFVGGGVGFYWLHTHDATGIIHVESPDNRKYTLGNFFDVWGEPLAADNVAGLKGKLQIFVDNKPYSGKPRDIVLTAHGQITLVVGEPPVSPPVYVFPEGL
jgi:hypothetical protein